MTKDEIKKALERCNRDDCINCPYISYSKCRDILIDAALNLIKEQESECEYRKKQYDNQLEDNTRLHIEYDKAFECLKAKRQEIEKLKANINQLQDQILETAQINQDYREQQIKQAKIDVLNELKEKCKFDGHTVAVYKNDIDELIKEVENETV